MTVPSQVSSVSYECDGVTDVFQVPFYFLANADLIVTLGNDEEAERLVLDSDYTVAGAGQPAGGAITAANAPAEGLQLFIERAPPFTQETAYQRNDPFPERAHERALDKLTMISQRLEEFLGTAPDAVSRVLRFPVENPRRDALLPRAAVRAKKALIFDEGGNLIVSEDNYNDQAAEAAASAAAAEAANEGAQGAASTAQGAASSASTDADRAESAASAVGNTQGLLYSPAVPWIVGPVVLPAVFSDCPVSFACDDFGRYTDDFDPAEYLDDDWEDFFVSAQATNGWSTGNNTNDGRSISTPKRTFAAVLQAAHDATTTEPIRIKFNGIFESTSIIQGSQTLQPGRKYCFYSDTGAILAVCAVASQTDSWSQSGNTWHSSNLTSTLYPVHTVHDAGSRDNKNIPVPYLKVADAAAVDTTPGSWFQDATGMYVNTLDGLTPSSLKTMFMLQTYQQRLLVGAGTVVVTDGLQFGGGQHALEIRGAATSLGSVWVSNNCRYFGADRNGYASQTVALSINHETVGRYVGDDAINYHNSFTLPDMLVVELSCEGSSAGVAHWSDDPNSNGSTAHEGIRVIRCNTVAFNTYGPTIADVGGGKTFCMGCFPGPSVRSPGSTKASWYFSDSGNPGQAEAWLMGCGGGGADNSAIGANSTAVKVNLLGWVGTTNQFATATLFAYSPTLIEGQSIGSLGAALQKLAELAP